MDDLLDNLVKDCKIILSPILGQSGAVLYSSFDTLKNGTFYVLGLNPGGSIGPTISDSLDSILLSKENAYLDEDWSSEKRHYDVGRHPLQKNLKFLFDYLGFNLREVCSSNLIFVRSYNQDGCTLTDAYLCWNVHRRIIDIVKPKVILVFGNSSNSPYSYILNLHKKYINKKIMETNIASGHGKWLCRSFITNLFSCETLILGLPHLSIYSLIDRNEVLIWIKNRINNHINLK